MTTDIMRPFISYTNDTVYLYPNVGLVAPLVDGRSVERYDNISASGLKHSYHVGNRRVLRVQFEWQDATLKNEWITFWEAIRGGESFTYHDDDSYQMSGTGVCGDGSICGTLSTGGATDSNLICTLDNQEFAMEAMDVYGYWRTPILEMRVVE